MPLQRLNKKAWEIEFQRAVSSIDENCGLTVTRSKIGNVELRHRGQGFNVVKTIPFKWEENWGDAYTRIRNIFKFIAEGHNLKAAAELAQGKAPKKGKDWVHILESFKDQKINFGTAITEATFNKQYLPPCEMVVNVMSKKNPPTNPADLIDICVKDWKPQSVSRKHRVRAIKQFLDHAVNREGIADIWTPPTDLSSHIGKAKKGEIQIQKAGAFESDIQILDFLKTLPTDSEAKKDADAATRWFNCFCLMAELGLRPIEINFLQVLFDPINKEHYWHCTFIKKAGNGATQPRRIEPLPLIDRDGNEVKWNLMERFKSNLLLLPERVTGEAAGTYLKRRESWIQLKADMKRLQGTNITCYSFRHYYALRCHLKLIDSGSASLSMGHSIEAHHRNYPYSKESTTTNAFKLARARSVA
ncbi:Hypothetical protein P9215_12791 [Prochlorococcus marinus str. MIT 9215]|uniref:Tyr recombinase domain-containing protein n=1 Tax=Prochlorococcus marinus (strain MIT 9215) TaxID=93060 RepID=A8G5L3_PROM2|nr:hypothetical protein [Prochlorococcus marinus]ABV50894.1 Hypothetical protein P9215_12791 [Prochlorococcus marinus str. MIT 9215]